MRASAEREGNGLPEGVLALVQARLEALDPVLRRVLRAASIFGRSAREYGIARLLGDEDAIEVVRSSLRALAQREVLESEREDASVVRFTHDLVRDAAYAMLTDDDRRTGHALAGAFLEAGGEKDAAMLAMHFDLGGVTASAAAWYARAAEQALERTDLATPGAHVARALELGATGEVRGRALYARSLALRWSGDCAAGLADARAAIGGFESGTARGTRRCSKHASSPTPSARATSAASSSISRSAQRPPTRARSAFAFASSAKARPPRSTRATRARRRSSSRRIEREAEPYMDDPGVALTVHRMRGVLRGVHERRDQPSSNSG